MAGEAPLRAKSCERGLDLSLRQWISQHLAHHPLLLFHRERCLLGSRDHQCPEAGVALWVGRLLSAPAAGDGVTTADSYILASSGVVGGPGSQWDTACAAQ